MRVLIAVVMSFLFSSLSLADASLAPNYQIEMLIFSHVTPQTLAMEQWPSVTPDFNAPSFSGKSNSLLPASALVLNRETADIQHQGGYRILSHFSWRAHLTSATQNLSVVNGNLYDAQGNLLAKNYSPPPSQNLDAQINGKISLNLTHYIDMTMDLFLTEPVSYLKKIDTTAYFNQFSQPSFAFQLSESRRMRSRELNYFWHPVMNVLVKIMPIHAPAPDQVNA